MASSKEYLEFVLEQLSDLEEITYRAMMGEYILYYRSKIVGGIYDDVVIAANTVNFLTLASDTKFSLSKDEEMTREFQFSFGENAPSQSQLSKLSVVVLALKKGDGGKAVVDNAAKCGYGNTSDYVYNE